MFIWALTMQNHTPYTASNIEKEALYIEVSGERISDIAKDKLTGYVNSLYESDRRLELLIDYLKESKKPTVLMFYGDHMPALYEVYYDTKMISTLDTTKWSTSEMKKLHEVPYFIYQNFDNQVKIKNTENVGAYKLGNMLLSLSNVKKSSYFSFIDSLKYIALRDRLFIDEKGNAYEEIQEGYVDEIYKHKLLQYDMIYGNNYVKEFEEEN
jgi:phosphoglycerol transferase MdoB-like AlkP superfamily enzyme